MYEQCLQNISFEILRRTFFSSSFLALCHAELFHIFRWSIFEFCLPFSHQIRFETVFSAYSFLKILLEFNPKFYVCFCVDFVWCSYTHTYSLWYKCPQTTLLFLIFPTLHQLHSSHTFIHHYNGCYVSRISYKFLHFTDALAFKNLIRFYFVFGINFDLISNLVAATGYFLIWWFSRIFNFSNDLIKPLQTNKFS